MTGSPLTAQTPPSAPESPPHPRVGVAYIGIALPEAISAADIERYAAILELAPEQQTFLGYLHAEYSEHWDKKLKDKIQALWQEASEAVALPGVPRADAIDDLHKQRGKLVRDIEARESLLFDTLATSLADAQEAKLETLRLDRRRAIHAFASGATRLPEGRPDLITLVDELDVPAEDRRVKTAEILLEYQRALVPVLERAGENHFRVLREGERLAAMVDDLRKEHAEGWQETGAALLEERAALHKTYLTILRRICDLNRQYLKRLRAVLPEPDARRLQERYLALSYGEIYPDREWAQQTIDDLRQRVELTEEQREALLIFEHQLAAAYGSLAERMHRQIEGWDEQRFVAPQILIAQIEEHKQRLEELRDERAQLNDEWRKRVLALVTPEQAEAVRTGSTPDDPR